MKLLATWLIGALAISISAWIMPGVTVSGFGSALLAALILGIVNAIIRPFILILTLPINILTLGLFTLVINTGMVALTAWILSGFSISNFWIALLFSIILSVITWFMEAIFKEAKHD